MSETLIHLLTIVAMLVTAVLGTAICIGLIAAYIKLMLDNKEDRHARH